MEVPPGHEFLHYLLLGIFTLNLRSANIELGNFKRYDIWSFVYAVAGTLWLTLAAWDGWEWISSR